MSRLDVRPTHAAGDSWRKWQDPVTYRRPWAPDLFLWAMCVLVGALAALLIGGPA